MNWFERYSGFPDDNILFAIMIVEKAPLWCTDNSFTLFKSSTVEMFCLAILHWIWSAYGSSRRHTLFCNICSLRHSSLSLLEIFSDYPHIDLSPRCWRKVGSSTPVKNKIGPIWTIWVSLWRLNMKVSWLFLLFLKTRTGDNLCDRSRSGYYSS